MRSCSGWFLLIFLLVPCLVTSGAEIVVNTTDDNVTGSLRAAVVTANSSAGDDTITFVGISAGSVFTLESGPLLVNSVGRITISAESLGDALEITSLGASRLFEVSAGATLELVDLMLTDGFAPPGDDGMSGDSPTDGGEGGQGGAIRNEGVLILRRCTLSQNFAGSGGEGGGKTGVPVAPSGKGGKGGSGGAISSVGVGAMLTAQDCLFRQNNAGNGGGAGSLTSGASGSPATGGAGGVGGAIFVEDGSVDLLRCQFESNRSGGGGIGGGNDNSGTGGDGGEGGDGGGVFCRNAAIRIRDCSFRNNAASNGGIGGDALGNTTDTRGNGGRGGHGGGLCVDRFASSVEAHVSGTLFNTNSAGNGASGADSPLASSMAGTVGGDGGSGGGLYVTGNNDAVWRLANTTVHRNFAGNGGNGGDGHNGGNGGAGGDAGNGGGIAFSRDGSDYTASLVHVTVVSNEDGTAGQGGVATSGGIHGSDGTIGSGGGIWEFPGGIDSAPGISLANSVVVANEASSIPNIGAFTAVGENFTSGNPDLGVLSDNGGPTLTLPPLLGSPLIDAGGALDTPLTDDQRGVARPFNGVADLGAYEATLQPDLRIGRTSNPNTHRIDGAYSVAGIGQTLSMKLKGMKTSKAFLSIENDGDIADDLNLSATPANRTIRLAVFRLTGGKQNITAQLAAGHAITGFAPGNQSLVEIDVRARSARRRANQTLSYTLRSSLTTFLDVAKTSVSQSK